MSTPATNGNGQSDVPSLVFVNPDEITTTYRVCLWAAQGEGKSVVACSAPGPILVISADRPTAYQFARAHWTGKRHRDIREIRYIDYNTLRGALAYLREAPGQPAGGGEIKTVIVDPLSNIYDQLVRTAPRRDDGDTDYTAVNLAVMNFLTQLRPLDVNVILIAHEKLNDGKKGDNKLYPALGGPSLINKVLAEMDIVTHLERQTRIGTDGEGREVPQARYVGQLQPANGIVCKESTATDLGPYRIANLSRWFQIANAATEEGMPWAEPDAGGWVNVKPPDDELDDTPIAVESDDPAPTVDVKPTETAPADPPDPTPAASPPTTLDGAFAAAIAEIAELRRSEDGLDELRCVADDRMIALNCHPIQRRDELRKADSESELRALIGLVNAATPAETGATA